MRSLREIEGCFQGVIPAYLATSDHDGTPNVAALSIVHLLGPERIGLSCQFMNKTLRNLRRQKKARILVSDPETMKEYWLDLSFERLTEVGPGFDRMDAHLAAIASQSGQEDSFSLAGVVECQVDDWGPLGRETADTSQGELADPLQQLDRVAMSIHAATDLDTLLDSTFSALDEHLGLSHGFMLLADRQGGRLFTVASHGFPDPRFGAEIAFGEGIYGTCAARRLPFRSGSLHRERMMSKAVARQSSKPDPRHLPLPGLENAESALAIPLVTGEQCLGVLCVQSRRPGAFNDACERTLTIISRHLSAMIAAFGAHSPRDIELSGQRGPVGSRALALRVTHYASDDSVFVDQNYLIKGVAGRILVRLLGKYASEQRDEFSNKEIRLDQSVGLPAFKDNLEARLIALRKRLAERDVGIRIHKTGRGKFRLEVDRELLLEEHH